MFKKPIKSSLIRYYAKCQTHTKGNNLVVNQCHQQQQQQQSITFIDFTTYTSQDIQLSEKCASIRIADRIVKEIGDKKLNEIVIDEIPSLRNFINQNQNLTNNTSPPSTETPSVKDEALSSFTVEFEPLNTFYMEREEEESSKLNEKHDPISSFSKLIQETIGSIYSILKSCLSNISNQLLSFYSKPKSNSKSSNGNVINASSNKSTESIVDSILKSSLFLVSMYSLSSAIINSLGIGMKEKILEVSREYTVLFFQQKLDLNSLSQNLF